MDKDCNQKGFNFCIFSPKFQRIPGAYRMDPEYRVGVFNNFNMNHFVAIQHFLKDDLYLGVDTETCVFTGRSYIQIANSWLVLIIRVSKESEAFKALTKFLSKKNTGSMGNWR